MKKIERAVIHFKGITFICAVDCVLDENNNPYDRIHQVGNPITKKNCSIERTRMSNLVNKAIVYKEVQNVGAN